ncbi:unnamed protein product [Kuraishia capsulata CBS 1993]|uniref:Uncharacterized protein n=1 Tax=Kuraishia capsulata CBS 1993 TaxID=1382522 RepID=W6MTS7_9ASCO|nr:uncharacterized protein KUCA_T00005887001 [Kuraishia capsulata CBS 1993]CDK29893.1 unnamed protein product [Kuraishia capsulata CBS 1993]
MTTEVPRNIPSRMSYRSQRGDPIIESTPGFSHTNQYNTAITDVQPQYYTFDQVSPFQQLNTTQPHHYNDRSAMYYDKSGIPYQSTDLVFTQDNKQTLFGRLKGKKGHRFSPTAGQSDDNMIDPMPVAANVNAYTRGAWMRNSVDYDTENWSPPAPRIMVTEANEGTFRSENGNRIPSGVVSFAGAESSGPSPSARPESIQTRRKVSGPGRDSPLDSEDVQSQWVPNKLWTYVASYLPQAEEKEKGPEPTTQPEEPDRQQAQSVIRDVPPLPVPPEDNQPLTIPAPRNRKNFRQIWDNAKRLKRTKKEVVGRPLTFEEFFSNTDDFSVPPIFENKTGYKESRVKSTLPTRTYQRKYEETINDSCNGLHERTRRTREVFMNGVQKRERVSEETVKSVNWSTSNDVNEEAALNYMKNIRDYHELMTGMKYPSKIPELERPSQQLIPAIRKMNPARLFASYGRSSRNVQNDQDNLPHTAQVESGPRLKLLGAPSPDSTIMLSNIHNLLTKIPYIGGFFEPLSSISSRFPEMQVVIVGVELLIFAVLLYEIHRMIDSMTMVVMTFCSPFITFVRFFGFV